MKRYTPTPLAPSVAAALALAERGALDGGQTAAILAAAVREQQWLKDGAMRRSCELLNGIQRIRDLKPVLMAKDYWYKTTALKPDDVFAICDELLAPPTMTVTHVKQFTKSKPAAADDDESPSAGNYWDR